jgi:glutamyl-tRNA synthetase
MSNVRVRIAPSPTGDPHVGTAYIGLFNYVFAKKFGGKFILRIEDTDQARSTKESEAAIFRSLRWVGLEWDEGPDVGGDFGPYRQSERTGLYRDAALRLVERGEAYRCFCTAERLEALRAEQRAAKKNLGYDRHCRNLSEEEVKAKLAAGELHVVRLKMPLEGTITVQDKLRGAIEFKVAEIDDQVLLKSDGFPTYHLANVVDDNAMQITHVIRAEEWITSTPKHVRLYQAFGWTPPEFVHMPLLRNADKSKISKRRNPVSLGYYERAGYLPEAMLNYLAMMGWTMPDQREKFTVAEMIESFDITRVSLGGPVFDLAKLSWLNGLYLRELSPQAWVERLRGGLLSDGYLEKVAALVRERVDKLEDFVSYADFFFTGSVPIDPGALAPKGLDAKAHKAWFGKMEELQESLDVLRAWDHAVIEKAIKDFVASSELPAKEVFMFVRLAVTGKSATPPLFETMEVLGRESCRWRMRQALAAVKTPVK